MEKKFQFIEVCQFPERHGLFPTKPEFYFLINCCEYCISVDYKHDTEETIGLFS